ncbi:hypothetical protein GCM10023190_24130 [Enteractinococcus fodinae]|uniref:Divalent metal cation (Fe/Co/Zn/Cd) transporter n=1 Tax=Enteractinococcus fodinae TaxID=684663 RepID=A0ABU2B2I0_9MICC|nr:cation transporter [Enteractinococcus fodinae]MDR7347822.1 divalent metal cation (Fe/Co/Zn/Cd) transporter [Enteractinococcus fodinae]
MTGSVNLFPDPAEAVVNLVAASVALVALKVELKPPGRNHIDGHSKVEYSAAAVERWMTFVTAAGILTTSVQRFLEPQPLENSGIGLGVCILAPRA